MTDRNETLNRLIEAARCLGATQARQIYGQYTIADGQVEVGLHKKIDQYRAALTQGEQEPFCYLSQTSLKENPPLGWAVYFTGGEVPLYTAPQHKKWVGLTDDEIENIWNSGKWDIFNFVFPFAQIIDAKLKEKNSV